MQKMKKALTVGATTLGLTAGMVVMAPSAQADSHAEWFNHLEVCKNATDDQAQHLRNKGYHVSVETYCKGEQYIGYRPQYYSEIHYY